MAAQQKSCVHDSHRGSGLNDELSVTERERTYAQESKCFTKVDVHGLEIQVVSGRTETLCLTLKELRDLKVSVIFLVEGF